MKKLGLVGGTGPESTVVYYKELNHMVNQAAGGGVFPPLVIDNADVYKALALCDAKAYDELTDYLLGCIRNLAAAGAQFAALTGNTVHIVFDRLQSASPIPLRSIIETTCGEAQRRGIKTLAVLGTRVTMEGDFFLEPFRRAGIRLLVPNEQERVFIHEKIADELEHGVVKEETRAAFLEIAARLQAQGAEALVLGCTELPLLFDGADCSLPLLDTMRVHIDALAEEILNG